MLPGPDLIYECPQCGNLLKQESLISGNTFGAKLYSDGIQIASMQPDFPNLTKCKKCNNIFWIEDLKEIGGYFKWWDSGGYIDEEFKTDDMKAKWEAAEEIKFLDIKDLHAALKITKDIEKEKTIRIWIWQAFNDRVRDGGEKMFVEKEDKDLWEENCCVLLNLLNRDDLNEKLLVAELYRNLGRFEDCIEILNNDESRNINWIKDPMKYLAKKNFTRVFPFQLFHLSEREATLPFFQMRGELKERQGDYQGALDDYDKAIFLDDSNPIFYVLKAAIYEKLKTLENGS
jgi:tetratricopeptide (TPR) repeat protein